MPKAVGAWLSALKPGNPSPTAPAVAMSALPAADPAQDCQFLRPRFDLDQLLRCFVIRITPIVYIE